MHDLTRNIITKKDLLEARPTTLPIESITTSGPSLPHLERTRRGFHSIYVKT